MSFSRCRTYTYDVSKLFVPEPYPFAPMVEPIHTMYLNVFGINEGSVSILVELIHKDASKST